MELSTSNIQALPWRRRWVEIRLIATCTNPYLTVFHTSWSSRCLQAIGRSQYLTGLCMRQVFPNSINTPAFPQCVLRPQMRYQATVIWRFYTHQ